jgi:hypothetical protein
LPTCIAGSHDTLECCRWMTEPGGSYNFGHAHTAIHAPLSWINSLCVYVPWTTIYHLASEYKLD